MPGTFSSPLNLVAWGLLFLGGILWLSLLFRIVQMILQQARPINVWARYAEEYSPYRRRRSNAWGWLAAVLLMIAGLVLVASGWGLLRLVQATAAYTPLAEDEVAARLQCTPLFPPAEGDESEPAVVTSTAAVCALSIGNQSTPYTLTVQSGHWGIEGEVLVWSPALERFGLRSGYRLLRLASYDDQGQVVAQTALLSSPGGLGSTLNFLDNRFPFVQASNQAARGEATAETLYELAVSRSGFFLRQWGPQQP